MNKKLMVVASIAIAIALWAYVIWEVNPTATRTFQNVPVTITGIEELESRSLTLADSGEYTVNVTLEGHVSAINALKSEDIIATADVSECIDGENIILVNVKTNQKVSVPTGKQVKLHINVDRITSSAFEVKVAYDDSLLESGTVISGVTPETSQVTITGASRVLDSISYVKAAIDLPEMVEEDGQFIAYLTPVNEEGEEVHNVTISMETIMVQVRFGFSKTVPIITETSGELAEGLKLESIQGPESITITGEKSDLNAVKSLKTEDIDLSKVKESGNIIVNLILPEGIRVADGSSTVTVKITVTQEEQDTDKNTDKDADKNTEAEEEE